MKCELCPNPAVQKHHIQYFPEETIPICDDCHKLIHSWKNKDLSKKYIKYKQGDAQIFYAQKERIEGFLSYLNKKK